MIKNNADLKCRPFDENVVQSYNSYLRVFFDYAISPSISPSSFTESSLSFVIEKKNVSLKDALANKLKYRNIDVDSCVIDDKANNVKVDWNTPVKDLSIDSVFISFKHVHRLNSRSIKEKLFPSNRVCCLCNGLYEQTCRQCDTCICNRSKCFNNFMKTPCNSEKAAKKNNNSRRSTTLKRKFLNVQNSNQILPLAQFTLTTRVRSLSDPDNSSLTDSHRSEKILKRDETKSDISNKSLCAKNKKPNRWSSLLSWEIPEHRIEINKNNKIGAGSFGVVHKGRDFFHGVVAVKFLNVECPTNEQINAFKNEVAILKSTRHDNILLFIGCFLSKKLAIVTEWCPGSSLYRHIHVDEVVWDMHQLIDIAKQTAVGMEYLHAHDILHRDLKSNNIFLIPKENYCHHRKPAANLLDDDHKHYDGQSRWTVKIGDFGLATVKSTWAHEENKKSQPTGSILWMAPEVITQLAPDPYSQKSDVYSYAVVLYELFSGCLPYENMEPNIILWRVGRGKLKLDLNQLRDDTPNDVKELICICSEFDREKRLDFVRINQRLRAIEFHRPNRSIEQANIKRSQSAPNLFLNTSRHVDDSNFVFDYDFNSDDEIYPNILINENYLPSMFG